MFTTRFNLPAVALALVLLLVLIFAGLSAGDAMARPKSAKPAATTKMAAVQADARRPTLRSQRAAHLRWPRCLPQAAASGAAKPAATGTLDDRVQELKGDVIRLNRDLLVLEEELLFPANTQVALFVSMDVGKLFSLDSVQIKLDDKVVTNYLYTPLEVQALAPWWRAARLHGQPARG